MKVALKLISFLILGVIALVTIDASVSIHREAELFRSEMEHDARMLGYTIKDLVVDVWRVRGQEDALALIDDANRDEQRISVRWVWLKANNGDKHQPHVPPGRILGHLGDASHVSLSAADERGSPFLYTAVLQSWIARSVFKRGFASIDIEY